VVWFAHLPTYAALAPALEGTPRILDLDNLQDWTLRRKLANSSHHAVSSIDERRWSTMRAAHRSIRDRIDLPRYAAYQQRMCADADAVAVCSELDRARLDVANAWVVPNAYEPADVSPRVTPPRPADAPVIAMVGLFPYGPNLDGARFFAEQVLPTIRERWPRAEFHMIGAAGPMAAALGRQPGVVVRGEVSDVAAEVRAAELSVVPIRYGSGTRIKAVESFALGVPVVATTMGVEGLDVVDGEHALLADQPDAYATACGRLLEDESLRCRLTAAAHQLWAERYRAVNVARAVTGMVAAVTATELTAMRGAAES
jgi:glycosyltransferase involved in cell wall biosynthesis